MKRRIVSLIFIAAVMFSLCSLSVSAKDDKVLQCTFSNDKATMEVFMSEYMDNDTNVMIGNEYFPVEVVNDVDVKTIFLVDKSTSMPKMVTEGLESMVSRYMSEMPANESISIIAFDSEIHHITDNYINSTEDLKTAVSKIKFDGNESYIYDCIIDTIDTLYTDDNSYYKIILMSDGWDRSERYTFEELKNKIDKNCRYHIDILQTTNYNQRNEKLSSIGSLSSNTYTFYRSEEDISALVEKEVCLLNVELNEKVTTGEYKGVTVKSSKGDVVLGSVLFSQIDWNSPELADRRGLCPADRKQRLRQIDFLKDGGDQRAACADDPHGTRPIIQGHVLPHIFLDGAPRRSRREGELLHRGDPLLKAHSRCG